MLEEELPQIVADAQDVQLGLAVSLAEEQPLRLNDGVGQEVGEIEELVEALVVFELLTVVVAVLEPHKVAVEQLVEDPEKEEVPVLLAHLEAEDVAQDVGVLEGLLETDGVAHWLEVPDAHGEADAVRDEATVRVPDAVTQSEDVELVEKLGLTVDVNVLEVLTE